MERDIVKGEGKGRWERGRGERLSASSWPLQGIPWPPRTLDKLFCLVRERNPWLSSCFFVSLLTYIDTSNVPVILPNAGKLR